MSDLVCTCRYFDPETVGLDFAGMLEDIEAAPNGSIILLHGKFLHCFLREVPFPSPARCLPITYRAPTSAMCCIMSTCEVLVTFFMIFIA